MALSKQNLAIPFSTGIDTFTDPLQVMPTNLIDLQNAVFTQDKSIQKRNGFRNLTTLPANTFPTTLTTFNNNLTVVGNSLQAYDSQSATWINKGRYQPVQLGTLSLVRSSAGQTAQDSATSGSLVCVVYLDSIAENYVYQINDAVTGQTLINPTELPDDTDQARVFVLGNYFIILFMCTVAATPHLQYIAIPIAHIDNPGDAVDISATVADTDTGYDAVVLGNYLYIGWNGSDMGGTIYISALSSGLTQLTPLSYATYNADLMSLCTDSTDIWVSWYDIGSTTTYTMAVIPFLLGNDLAPTVVDSTETVVEMTSSAISGTVSIFNQNDSTYSFGSMERSDFISKFTCTVSGTVSSPSVVLRSVGLGSKSFVYNDVIYMLAAYQGTYQPTYFLIDSDGNAIAKLAYSNGGGYAATSVLPSVSIDGTTAQVSYLIKDLLAPITKVQGSTQPNIYSQTGVNLATFDLSGHNLSTAEIGNNLHIAGGFVWMYDGQQSVEHNFHLWPEDILATPAASGGSMSDQTYFYQVTYEWTDTQGNIHRSAPSVPVEAEVSGGSGSGSVTLDIPNLRITYKTDVRITIYRWSTGQQAYHMVTDLSDPTLNDPDTDSISYEDDASDSEIAGNLLIYTTGGVLENIAYPATNAMGLFKSRLFVVDAEDPDLLWYSKQVIEGTPVEPNDTFTLFTAPTLSSQGSTGPTKVISAMDDKLICFKKDAIYYIVGTGPDNLGQNNDFSDPIFITSTVGSDNVNSPVFIPQGLFFQGDKGMWLLGRDLSTQYLGAFVQAYNNDVVTSAVGIPGTNQVRFTLDNEKTLMYDYFFQRWGTFTNIDAISSCIYNNMHTYLTNDGIVRQETNGYYQDGTRPVLIAFTTAWMNLMGLQGFQRAYMLYILGNYISPHKLSVTIAYDYNSSPSQNVVISPTNFSGDWGVDPPYWGTGGYWGGNPTLEWWRIFLKQQKITAFQVSVQESFDSTFGTIPGAGLTLSGLNLVVGAKKGYIPLPASNSVG